ncbi:hypothetical protein HanHA89_Chr13g0497181 [Helianthus annuus]|nr:hypothetical protein HanHA89_Chr13g0497181 [Helianthus annuus]
MHGFKLREEDVKLPQYKNDDLVLNLIPELISRRLMAQNEIVKSVSRFLKKIRGIWWFEVVVDGFHHRARGHLKVGSVL